MLRNVLPFSAVWEKLHPHSTFGKSLLAFIRFLESRLGGTYVYDVTRTSNAEPTLIPLLELAARLQARGVLKSFSRASALPDEPKFSQWRAECGTKEHHVAGGMAVRDDAHALTTTLAECLERFIWLESMDYFANSFRATAAEAGRKHAILEPAQFTGFSTEQRANHPRLAIRSDARFLWIQGTSIVDGSKAFVPAQVVSGAYGSNVFLAREDEPIIRTPITTGLATGPTRDFARLGGMLEIIERDAFMITWLNQLPPWTVNLSMLRKKSDELDALLTMCERYRLHASVSRLPTDAPAYVLCASVWDESEVGPSVTIGLRADSVLERAARGAILEALRMRHTIRNRKASGAFVGNKAVADIFHIERADYWTVPGRSERLVFLRGGGPSREHEEWDDDNDSQHLQRIVEWCRRKDYAVVAVDMTRDTHNVSPWKMEMVVVPDLMPMHQNERFPYTSSPRLQEIPTLFGYTPRAQPFLEEPHPFA